MLAISRMREAKRVVARWDRVRGVDKRAVLHNMSIIRTM
jgi:hypothetical protein